LNILVFSNTRDLDFLAESLENSIISRIDRRFQFGDLGIDGIDRFGLGLEVRIEFIDFTSLGFEFTLQVGETGLDFFLSVSFESGKRTYQAVSADAKLGIESSEVFKKTFIAFVLGFGLVEVLQLLGVFLFELLESCGFSSILVM